MPNCLHLPEPAAGKSENSEFPTSPQAIFSLAILSQEIQLIVVRKRALFRTCGRGNRVKYCRRAGKPQFSQREFSLRNK